MQLPEDLVRAGDGVAADVAEGGGAVPVPRRDPHHLAARGPALLHGGGVLLLAPLRDVLVNILHRDVHLRAAGYKAVIGKR